MKCYSETHKIDINDILILNIDIKYKKYLLKLYIEKPKGRFGLNTYMHISENDGIFEYDDLKKYCEHHGVIVNDYCFKNIRLEHCEYWWEL